MSQITENTIVLPAEAEERFLQQVAQYQDQYRLADITRVYHDQRITIYTFDCNGDNPWMIECTALPWHILEINYLDGEGPYTMLPEGDSEQCCASLLAEMIEGEALVKAKEKIAYSS